MKKSSSLLLAVASATAVAALTSCKPQAPAESSAAPTPQPAAASAPAASAATPAAPATAAAPEASPTAPAAGAVDLKDPVASVNGEPITKAQLEEAFNDAVKAAGVPVDQLSPEQKMEGYRQLLDDMILDKLITKASAGVTVSPEQVDAEMKKIKANFPNEEAFTAQLTEVGQTPEKFTDNLRKMIQQRQWVESQIKDQTAVSDDDVKKFYDENVDKFKEDETVQASHILFMVKKDAPEDEVKKQQEAAKKAIARAKKEDFTKLAKELSQEPGAAESGGELGYFSREVMVPEFADAAFKQDKGSVSKEPVRTEFGWHVIKVTDKKPAGTVPFDQAKEQIQAYLKSQKQGKAVRDLLDSVKGSAKIDNTLPPPPPAPPMPDLSTLMSAPEGAAQPAESPAASPAPAAATEPVKKDN